ncbi:MAG TPA: hypothetical protein VGL95_01960 [Acetobacteraceae bacterium]|jgi:hypothetical protein
MTDAEIDTWSSTVPPAAVCAVGRHAEAVNHSWRLRLRDADELVPMMAWCAAGAFAPAAAAYAAAAASIELIVICAIWPKPLDDVLRPGVLRIR